MKAMGVLVTGVMLAAGMPAWGAEAVAGSTAPAVAGEPAAAAEGEAAAADAEAPAAEVVAEKPATLAKVPVADVLKLKRQIQVAFRNDPDLKNNHVAITVDSCNSDEYGIYCNVTLAGAVDTQAERIKAEEVARLKGVVLVDNLLDLGDDAKDGIADGAVTTKVREQLLADHTFKNAIISISTTNGVVTLVGTVPSDDVRRQAGEKVSKSRAVKRVHNGLRVEQAPMARQWPAAASPPLTEASVSEKP